MDFISFVLLWFFTDCSVAESDEYFIDLRIIFSWSEYGKVTGSGGLDSFLRERERFVLSLHDHYKPAVQDEQFAMTLQGMYKSLPACFNFVSKHCSENSRAAELSI